MKTTEFMADVDQGFWVDISKPADTDKHGGAKAGRSITPGMFGELMPTIGSSTLRASVAFCEVYS